MSTIDQQLASLLGGASLSNVLLNVKEIESSLAQDKHRASPSQWVEDKLHDSLWSKQREIIESVRDHRRTAVHSCHSSGKSFLAARITCWWLETHKPGEAFVVTSAPTGRQVRAILWREIGRAHASGKLLGRLNQTEWWATMPAGNEEMIAFGQKPSDLDPTAFQGIHARYVLVIFDESCGIPKSLWEAADTLLANEDSRFLAIGNPDDPLTEFADVCKPGSGWNVIGIDAFETPNFTGEKVSENVSRQLISRIWEQEKKRKWGETNPLYISKVRGQFPELSTDGLIPISWVKAAQARDLSTSILNSDPNELGVDVGGGTNKSTIAHRKGPYVRIIHKSQDPNTMNLLGQVIRLLKETDASVAKVDYIGIGKGMVDRAQEITENREINWEWASRIKGVNVGKPAWNKEEFVNLRAEGYYTLRKRHEDGMIDIDPNDDDLAAQLVDLKIKYTGGRLQIESKDDIRRRGRESPDEADAVMLAYVPDGPTIMEIEATWGR